MSLSVTYPNVNIQTASGPEFARNFKDLTDRIGIGTTTNDNAAAGEIGEFLSSTNSTGTSLSSGVTANITSVPLTAGDWDVWGFLNFGAGAITGTYCLGALSTTNSGTGSVLDGSNISLPIVPIALIPVNMAIGPIRVSVSSQTNYFINAQAGFTIGTMTVKGVLYARRKR